MKHIVIDLEMNTIRKSNPVRSICGMETIEIGAVMMDENMQEISSFRTYVKPEYNDSIAPKIRRLTGISDEMLINAPKFGEALKMFTAWCNGTGDEVEIYAWSDTDYKQIKKEMTLKSYEISKEEEPLLAEEWKDFQREFDAHLGFEKQLSLNLALNMAGIDFSGREHDALDDARNTAELLQVFKDEELFEKTLKKIEEVMKPSGNGFSLGDIIDLSTFGVEQG